MSVRNTWWWSLGTLIAGISTWFVDDPMDLLFARLAVLICVATFAILTKLDGWSNKMGGRG